MSVTVTNASTGESPFTTEFIINLVEERSKDQPINEFINTVILPKLQKKSSKHKFLVQATSLEIENPDLNLHIGSSFGAVWDSAKDGYISLKVSEGEKHLLITVFWLYC